MVATTSRSADELAAPLDLLLTSSAVGMADRLLPNVAWSRFALNLAKQPRTVASRAASLGRELVSIAEGRSELAPAKGDKRFADPAWRGNPLLHRTMQAYLAANNTVDQLFRTRTSTGVTPSGFDSCWISSPKGSHRATTRC